MESEKFDKLIKQKKELNHEYDLKRIDCVNKKDILRLLSDIGEYTEKMSIINDQLRK